MSRVRFALFLMAVALCFLLPEPRSVRAANAPVFGFPAACNTSNGNNNGNASLTCYLSNVTSGNTIVVFGSAVATAFTITSATETLSCSASIQTGAQIAEFCFVQLASNHASFVITETTTAGLQAATNISAWQVQGLGTFDTSASAAAATVSITTAATNEMVITYCADFGSGSNPVPGAGQQQIGWGAQTPVGSSGQPVMTETIIEASSGAHTVGYTNSGTVPMTVAAAFTAPGVSPPAINIINSCTLTLGTTFASTGACPLNGKQNGTTVIIYALGLTTNTPPASISGNCSSTSPTGATCTFPAGAQATATFNTAGYVAGIGYSVASGAFGQFVANYSIAPTPSGAFLTVAIEVTGLVSVDTPSAAAAAATTVNYTTATTNEFTAAWGTNSSAITNPFTPGNSFLQAMGVWGSGAFGAGATPMQGAAMVKTTASSGSNTASYSVTSSSNPLISTLSFGPSATTPSSRVKILGYHGGAHVHRIPWDRPRKQLELERI